MLLCPDLQQIWLVWTPLHGEGDQPRPGYNADWFQESANDASHKAFLVSKSRPSVCKKPKRFLPLA